LKWLESFINVVFPDNRVEYWSTAKEEGRDVAPTFKIDQHLRNYGCFVRRGNCEGEVLELYAFFSGGQSTKIGMVKCFDSKEDCWKMAAAISDAIDSLVSYHEVPEIVDFMHVMPRTQASMRSTSLKDEIELCVSAAQVSIRCGEHVLWNRDFSDDAVNAKFRIAPVVKDWITVLTSMSANFKLTQSDVTATVDPA
jgi:hypothetical protein